MTSVLDIFRKQPNQGVSVVVQPSQVNRYPDNTEVTATLNDEGDVITSGQSVPKPEPNFPPQTAVTPFVRHRTGSTSNIQPVPQAAVQVPTGTDVNYRGQPSQIPVEVLQRAAFKANQQFQQAEPNVFGGYSVEATSAGKRYRDFIANRNPVTASVEYGIEQGRGYLSKEFEGLSGQNPFGGKTGETLSRGAQIGSYFIPVAGEVLAIGSAGGQFLTPGGQAEIKQGFQKGILTGTGIVAGAGLAGVGGGLSGVSRVGRFAKVPRTNIVYTSEQTQPLWNGWNFGTTSAVAETRNLFGTNIDVIAMRSLAKANPTISPDVLNFKSVGQGVTTRYLGSSPINGRVFSEPTPFVSTSSGLVSGEGTLSTFFFGGKSQTGKVVQANFIDDLTLSGQKVVGSGKPTYFAGGGVSAEVNPELNLIYSKSAPVVEVSGTPRLSSQGISRSFGFLRTASEPSGADFIFTKFKGSKSNLPSQIALESNRASIESLYAPKPKPFISKVTEQARPVQSQTSRSEFYGTGKYERTESTIPLLPVAQTQQTDNFFLVPPTTREGGSFRPRRVTSVNVFISPTEKQDEGQKFGTPFPRTNQNFIPRTGQGQTPRVVQNFFQSFKPVQAQREGLRSGTLQKQAQKNKTPIVIIPLLPIPSGKKKSVNPFAVSKSNDFFSTFIRRRGKFAKVGTSKSFLGAFNLGVQTTKRNLSRSFRIAAGNKFLKLKPTSSEFRKSRNPKDQFSLIQKAPFALSSKSEVSEIQNSRRRSKWFS